MGNKTVPSISNRARSMQASPLRKLASIAEERKKNGIKVYHLNIGQPDLPTDKIFYEQLLKIPQTTVAYAPSNGMPQTIKAWKKYFEHVGIQFDEKEIIVTQGGSEAIIFAMCSICDVDEEIIVFEPFYTNYNGFATLVDVKLVPIPLSIQNGFHLPTEEEIEKYITPKTRGILITNPSNPTGTVYSKEELQRLVNLVKKYNLFLLSDEVYREFAYEGKFFSVMDFPEISQQTILLDSASKRFNLCGARIGVLASHNEDVVQSAFKFGMARLSVATIEQLAIIPMLENPFTYTAPIVEEFRRRRDVVYEALSQINGVTYYKPEGAFYIIIGLPVKDSEHFARWLIEEFDYNKETVLLAPAQGFYATPGKGTNEVRLAFMLNVDDMKKSLKIISIALEEYLKKFN
ncbi:MAG: pyridoxal phosphate-dependent aminotransferase [Ignavibacteria bacterium]|jgi:aspartate aminotransferase|nr:pyridoxal phosphate-dependent aminotransferase [Ignavibacteria bacterium]MDH7528011.1 pyridoxal phosphate-dependent aminotransferase [Ignavibacteria bacterium]